jgi:hypothetical protein
VTPAHDLVQTEADNTERAAITVTLHVLCNVAVAAHGSTSFLGPAM